MAGQKKNIWKLLNINGWCFDYQYAFILCGGDGNGARIAGRLPNGYKLTIENNEKD